MSSLKTPENITVRNRHIPNSFILFVKEQNTHLLQNCADEDKNAIAALIGKKWRSMSTEQKQVYFDKHKVLKIFKDDKLVSDSMTEDEELSMDVHTNEEDMAADHGTNKFTNKSIIDELTEGNIKNYKNSSPTLSDIGTPLSSLVTKVKPLKKARRPPNAFMLFASEQRRILDPSIIKEQRCHVNTVLGSMWRDLSDSEKAKYLHEARQLLKLHKKSETSERKYINDKQQWNSNQGKDSDNDFQSTPSSKIPKKERKVRFKLPKKTVERVSKEKKKCLPKTTTSLRSFETDDIKKTENESNSSKPAVEKIENTGLTRSSTEHLVSIEYPISPSSSSQQHNNMLQSQFLPMVPSTESHHSQHCCCRSSFSPDYSSNNSKQYLPSNTGMSRSCFGAGLFPPMIPSYPFNAPFWMHQQAMMAHPMLPFPSFGFPPSPCGYSSPYSYSSAYFNAYGGLYTGGIMGPCSYGSHPSSSATVTANANIKESSAEVTKNSEYPEDELLVVDETSRDGEQNQESETS